MVARREDVALDAPQYAWLAAPALVLLARNRYPLTVFLAVSALVWSYYATGHPGGPAAVYAIFALFSLTMRRGPLVAGVAGAAVLTGWVVAGLVLQGGLDGRAGFVVAWSGMAVAAGAALTARRNTMAARRERAEERTMRLAEEERLRIAREVHDVVAHSLAMINVQAGVGAHVADRRPEQAKAALLAIKEASHTALADLRATLAVLRSGQGRAPAPSLRRLAELTEPTAAAGLRVDVDGNPGELPAPVDSAAYRIVQESLTNAVRHAKDASRIRVRFARTAGSIEVVVSDDGSGSVDPDPGSGSGNGLRGMRERAAALGGTLTAGARPEGGFEVRAVLPVVES
ncbi:MAG TPA: sensor histidine kinase [Actinophytocola sp.]|uniref:sensor histidine kinase n=1 Tax=Actinophytocola sp. TaxID=1872138 RepID=UPI002DDD0F01|nr:sensor histidine kinase [Actinophytocola sp.]HEV2780603.1 sensor histidine kinase [Actinophytocola sp.]